MVQPPVILAPGGNQSTMHGMVHLQSCSQAKDDLAPLLLSMSRERELCWVSNLKDDVSKCTPGFRPGHGSFMNKFCLACRSSAIIISAEHIRVLTPELEEVFRNTRSSGFWSITSTYTQFRVINNTVGSRGPPLVIFRGRPPAIASESLPAELVTWQGQALLLLTKGSFVPQSSLELYDKHMRNHSQYRNQSQDLLGKRKSPAEGSSDGKQGMLSEIIAPPSLTPSPAHPVSMVPQHFAVVHELGAAPEVQPQGSPPDPVSQASFQLLPASSPHSTLPPPPPLPQPPPPLSTQQRQHAQTPLEQNQLTQVWKWKFPAPTLPQEAQPLVHITELVVPQLPNGVGAQAADPARPCILAASAPTAAETADEQLERRLQISQLFARHQSELLALQEKHRLELQLHKVEQQAKREMKPEHYHGFAPIAPMTLKQSGSAFLSLQAPVKRVLLSGVV